MDDIVSIVQRFAAENTERAFLILEREGRPTRELTYGALVRRAESYAASFRRLGLSPGELVVVMLVSEPDLAPAFLGAMVAGLIPSVFAPATSRQIPEVFLAQPGRGAARWSVPR